MIKFTREQQEFIIKHLKRAFDNLKNQPRILDDVNYGAIGSIYSMISCCIFDKDLENEAHYIYTQASNVYLGK